MFQFRLQDASFFARRRANEDAVVAAHFAQAKARPLKTCATCSCGKPREAIGLTPSGNVSLGCRDQGVARHLVTVPLAAAGAIIHDVDRSPEAFDLNTAVAYALAKRYDVPAKLRGCRAGPILTGGGTIYRPGSTEPEYPSKAESAFAGKYIAAMYAEAGNQNGVIVDSNFESIAVADAAEEIIEVRPSGRGLKKRGAV